MTGTALADIEAAEERLKEDVLRITSRLLDNYYDAHPTSNAFGCDYEGDYDPRTQRPESDADPVPSGSWFVGRADGADGAEKDCGVDYIVRRHEDATLSPRARRRQDDTSERHYLFGDYGWPRYLDELRHELDLYRQAIEAAVEDDYLDEDDLDAYDHAIDRFEDALERARRDTPLEEIANYLRENDMDALRPLLVDGDDGRVLWQLLHSKNEDDDVIENDVEVPVVSEGDEFVFARTDRIHVDRDRNGNVEEVNEYPFGVVIGVDDTSEVFFVHRLRNHANSPLGDSDTEWTAARVKEEMGFDINYDDVVAGDIPLDTTVRVQGDLAVVRHDYRTHLWEHYEEVLEDKIGDAVTGERHYDRFNDDEKEYHPAGEWLDANPRIGEGEIDGLYVGSNGRRFQITVDDEFGTDALKEMQAELEIDEETVREAFDTLPEHADCSRLTAKQRRQIIEHLLRERAVEWMHENADGMPSREALEAEAEEDAREVFENTQQQYNRVFGNHTVICGPARRHPNTRQLEFVDRDTLDVLVVPDEATLMVWHDEHQNKKVTLQEGVYEFRFLDGHEDNWWDPRR